MTTAIGMAAVAWLVVLGIYLEDGFHSRPGLLLITAAIGVCAATVNVQRRASARRSAPRILSGVVMAALLVQTRLLIGAAAGAPSIQFGIALVGGLALVQRLDLKAWRVPLFAVTAALFALVASMASITNRDPQIDVFTFQQTAASALEHGADPYNVRIQNLYPPTTQNYGPGVVDVRTNTLTYGLPYPPFSLLLVLPAHAIGGDIRYADVAAIAIAAALIVMSRPSRWTGLVASAFLLTPEVFFLISSAWTEALMALTFSVVMFTAVRWRAALPYALGAFFATKQYSVVAVPLVWLLLDEPASFRAYLVVMAKAACVALLLTVPFFFWNPDSFWRSVVLFQFIQPLRIDALSHLVWMHNRLPRFDIVRWTPFALLLPTTAFALWKAERSPAGFAAALTLVYLTFVAFNKQAFYNYYYFTVATAWWAAASAADD